MGPLPISVPNESALPEVCDTVIIGGGIIGVTAALYLAEAGQRVVLVEKGHIAGEQSSRNWGWCRQGRRDPREFDLIRESLTLWRGMNAAIGAETGFATCGSFFGARNAATEMKYEQWTSDARQAGIYGEMVSSSKIAEILPGDIAPPRTGLFCAMDGRAEPQLAVPRIAIAAIARGATIVGDCAARGIEIAGGQVVAVVTEHGPVRCNAVVVAGGVWTRRILRDLGIHIPQLSVRATVSRTQPIAGGPNVCFWDEVLGVRRRADGGFTLANGLTNVAPVTPDSFRFFHQYLPLLQMEWKNVKLSLGREFVEEWRSSRPVPYDRPSPYEAVRVLDPPPDHKFVTSTLLEFRRRFPSLSDVRLVQVWGGMIDAMPDTIPVISPVAEIAGLIVATGFSGHGFGIGPGAGRMVADLIEGRTPIADPRPFRLERFTDGSRPRPFTGV
jgi:glycine/D-amino acid oxidase-like deaminating enzyme